MSDNQFPVNSENMNLDNENVADNLPQENVQGQQVHPHTNTLAVVSLVSSFFVSVVAIITGHIALSQIKKTGEQGKGLAVAGTIIGYIGFVLSILITGIIAITLFAASSQVLTTEKYMNDDKIACEDFTAYVDKIASEDSAKSIEATLNDMDNHFTSLYPDSIVTAYVSDMVDSALAGDYEGFTKSGEDVAVYCNTPTI